MPRMSILRVDIVPRLWISWPMKRHEKRVQGFPPAGRGTFMKCRVTAGDYFRRLLREWGAAAHRGDADARQGRATNAMLKHRGGVLTPYGAANPLCPTGVACASLGGLAAVPEVSPGRLAARLCGTGPSASLGVLAVTQGYACELPPSIWPRGASNAARPTLATAF